MGVSTSCVYLWMHYLPNIQYVKKKLIDEGVDISDIAIFKPYQIVVNSISILTVFSLFSPLLCLGLLNPKAVNETNRRHIMEKACEV